MCPQKIFLVKQKQFDTMQGVGKTLRAAQWTAFCFNRILKLWTIEKARQTTQEKDVVKNKSRTSSWHRTIPRARDDSERGSVAASMANRLDSISWMKNFVKLATMYGRMLASFVSRVFEIRPRQAHEGGVWDIDRVFDTPASIIQYVREEERTIKILLNFHRTFTVKKFSFVYVTFCLFRFWFFVRIA